MRRCTKVGERYFEPAKTQAARSECAKTSTSARAGHGGFTPAMFSSSTVALGISLLICAPALLAEPRVDVVSQIIWEPEIKDFGGLSALEVSADGQSFVTISDTGIRYDGGFARAADGNLKAATLSMVKPLLFEQGRRPDAKRGRDTEGLALAADDTAFITAESHQRLLIYTTKSDTPKRRGLPPRPSRSPSNTGFEALAITPKGELITLAEGSASVRETPA